MKKTLSILMTVTMLFAMLAPALAKETCDCAYSPVVSIRGFGADLYTVDADGTEKNAFSMGGSEISTLASSLVGALTNLALKRDYSGFVSQLKAAVDVIADGILCDENGDSIQTVVTHSDPTDVDTHQGTNYIYFRGDEHNNYVFNYDWRMSALDIADQLDAYIQEVKAVTGHDTVTLISHSEGNNVTAAYFYKYGSADVNKSIHMSPAFQGISIVGGAFSKQVDLKNKGSALYDFLATVMGDDGVFAFLNALVAALNDVGALNTLTNALSRLFDKTLEQMYAEVLIDTFATMPALWSFVPDENYEAAKEAMFGGNEKYGRLIEKIDDYHYNIQNHAGDILKAAMAEGTPCAITCGYGISVIPVTTETQSQGDFLIDTKYASLGATVAPFGGALEESDSPYLSPDRQIDASTCTLPDNTWFLKYQSHNSFCDPYTQFILWLVQFDGQPTVTSNEAYPQFLICVNHEYLRPVQPEDERQARSFLEIFIDALTSLFRKLFSLLQLFS